MSHVIQLSIPMYDSVLCLAYWGACERLSEHFPEAVFAEEWSEVSEYQRLLEHLEQSNAPEETRRVMTAQMRTRHIKHGPTIDFKLPRREGRGEITGSLSRWQIAFHSETPFAEPMKAAIGAFLKTFAVGTVESYEADGG